MLELRHLVKSFGPLVAVDDVSFTVPQGEVLGFLGPNGAGKSTTMKMITGFIAPTGIRLSTANSPPSLARRCLGHRTIPVSRPRASR